MKQNNLIFIVAAVVIAGGAFFAGMKYQESKRPNSQTFRQGRQIMGDFGNLQGRSGMMGARAGLRPVSGEIIGADEKTLTVKLQDGSTKIVILSKNTVINKSAEGTKSDLKTGEKVAVFGSENSDGSVTAQSIQLNLQFRTITSTPSAK